MPKVDDTMSLLTAINCIVVIAEGEALSDEFHKAAKDYLKFLADRQELNEMQALLFAILVEKSAAGSSVEVTDIARFLCVNNVKMLHYRHCLDELVKLGLVRKMKTRFGKIEYSVPDEVVDRIVDNQPYRRKSLASADGIEFFQNFYDITHLRFEEEISSEQMVDEVMRLFRENPDNTFVKAVTSKKLTAVLPTPRTQREESSRLRAFHLLLRRTARALPLLPHPQRGHPPTHPQEVHREGVRRRLREQRRVFAHRLLPQVAPEGLRREGPGDRRQQRAAL